MKKKPKPGIAVLDKNRLQKEMLHHLLERQHYEILFSCTDLSDLIKNSYYHQPEIVLVNGEKNRQGIEDFLSKQKRKTNSLSIIFYNMEYNAQIEWEFSERFKTKTYFVSEGFSRLSDLLDNIIDPPKPVKVLESAKTVLLLSDNPFFKIADNKNYMSILEMLKNGKSIKQIADVLGLTNQTVKTYLKKMRNISGYSNTVQMVYQAREFGVI
jgi:DNA-binding CsgD family transcriptional regulator